MFVISSCEKDDENDSIKQKENPIANTTWYSDDHPMTILYSQSRYWFSFDADSNVELWWSKDKKGTYYKTHGEYKYTVNGSTVAIKNFIKNDDGSSRDLEFTLRANNSGMSLKTNGYSYFSTLTKN